MSGTMRERPVNSKRWELRAYAGRDPETGNPRQVSRIFRGGKREARKALDKLVGEVDAGQHVGTTATFGKLLDLWLAKVEDLGKARTTLETYRQHVEKYIRPALGGVRLDKLDTFRLDQYFQALRAKGLAAGTVKLDHSVVSACSASESITDGPRATQPNACASVKPSHPMPWCWASTNSGRSTSASRRTANTSRARSRMTRTLPSPSH